MAPLNLKRMNGTVYVECLIRRNLLVLTPEEWVRQHVIYFLIEQGVPKGLIASEVSLKYHERAKRADIIVYGKDQQPVWIIECKATDVPLSEAVFRQIASYNHTLKVEYLMMTNGLEHIYAHIDKQSGKLTYLTEFPSNIAY